LKYAAAAKKKHPPLHPLERAVLVCASLLLILLPWTYGLNRSWAHFGGLALGVATFVVALWPRNYTTEIIDGVPFRIVPWRRLARFPLFWLGLLFFALQVTGMFNPAWFRESNGYAWTLLPLPNIEWLPTNVDVSPLLGRPWLIISTYAAAWLLVCALWIGITRRRALQILCWVILANAFALVAVGLAHRFSGAQYEQTVLWTRFVKDSTAFGAFVYRNHAGAYLCLMVSLAVALASWTHFDGRKRFAHSTPAAVWLFLGAVFAVGIAFTYARSAFAIMLVFALTAALGYIVVRLRQGVAGTTPKTVTFALLLAVGGAGAFIISQLDFSVLEKRFEAFQKFGADEVSYKMRVEARERAVEMWRDHGLRGTGAGSFEYLFHRYIRGDKFLTTNGRAYWDHAHIDWLEIPIEQGVAGTALLALAFLWWLWRWLRNGGWAHPFALMVFLGALQTLLHAYVDFPFQHPAVIVTWWALLIVALRWTEVEPVAAPERGTSSFSLSSDHGTHGRHGNGLR
jgi:O-antigen ligase